MLILFLFLAWRRRVAHRKRRLHEETKSMFTDWSNDTFEKKFQTPDFHDLSLAHSKLDVHRCSSTLCKVCRPDMGDVNMVKVGRNKPSLEEARAQAFTMSGGGRDHYRETNQYSGRSSSRLTDHRHSEPNRTERSSKPKRVASHDDYIPDACCGASIELSYADDPDDVVSFVRVERSRRRGEWLEWPNRKPHRVSMDDSKSMEL